MDTIFVRCTSLAAKSRGARHRLLMLASVAGACVCSAGLAQATEYGTYVGSAKLSGTRTGPEVTYSATVQFKLPVTDRDDDTATAEFFGGEAPDATVSITQWDSSYTDNIAESDGKFSSWKCSLAGPTEIPMTPTGVLNIDFNAKEYALSMTLSSTQSVKHNCVHSRTGAYQKAEGITLYVGTSIPGEHAPLPFTDPAHLAASYTLTARFETKGEAIVQEWTMDLAR